MSIDNKIFTIPRTVEEAASSMMPVESVTMEKIADSTAIVCRGVRLAEDVAKKFDIDDTTTFDIIDFALNDIIKDTSERDLFEMGGVGNIDLVSGLLRPKRSSINPHFSTQGITMTSEIFDVVFPRAQNKAKKTKR